MPETCIPAPKDPRDRLPDIIAALIVATCITLLALL